VRRKKVTDSPIRRFQVTICPWNSAPKRRVEVQHLANNLATKIWKQRRIRSAKIRFALLIRCRSGRGSDDPRSCVLTRGAPLSLHARRVKCDPRAFVPRLRAARIARDSTKRRTSSARQTRQSTPSIRHSEDTPEVVNYIAPPLPSVSLFSSRRRIHRLKPFLRYTFSSWASNRSSRDDRSRATAQPCWFSRNAKNNKENETRLASRFICVFEIQSLDNTPRYPAFIMRAIDKKT